jgi:hypothetical protein
MRVRGRPLWRRDEVNPRVIGNVSRDARSYLQEDRGGVGSILQTVGALVVGRKPGRVPCLKDLFSFTGDESQFPSEDIHKFFTVRVIVSLT